MSDIAWGEPIEVNGVRPEWLENNIYLGYKRDGLGWFGPYGYWSERDILNNGGWHNVTAIRIPASHPYYTVQRYNAEHGTSFVYWPGGDDAPADWDGSGPLGNDDGSLRILSPACFADCWKRDTDVATIIGYTRRTEPRPATDDSDYVLVKRMTEDEWWTLWHGNSCLSLGNYLGIIKPEPTEAERIAAKIGLTPEQVQVVLDAMEG